VIHPVGERQWEDVNWNNQGHRSCVNMKLGTFCRLVYPDIVPVGSDVKLHARGLIGRSGSTPTRAPLRMPWRKCSE
jgi:hypothetical protein